MDIDQGMRQQIAKYASALASFSASPSRFRILHSIPATSLPPPKTLYILDSSFNPPTLAHLRIATSALLNDSLKSPSPKRLLLLLAIQNADKAPKPATFEQRLAMMEVFASDILSSIPADTENGEKIGIDIGVTKLPYFIDKAAAIDDSTVYPGDIQQVHMTGFDTLIRILDPKYYGPEHSLKVLEPFFKKNRLRVTYRTDSVWGSREAQDDYLADLGKGKREGEGAKREWATENRIVMCEGRQEGGKIISSTEVRKAAKEGNREGLERLITRGVADWILDEGLYVES